MRWRAALAGGYKVLNAPSLSHSGAAKQMYLRDPKGLKIELNEILKKPN